MPITTQAQADYVRSKLEGGAVNEKAAADLALFEAQANHSDLPNQNDKVDAAQNGAAEAGLRQLTPGSPADSFSRMYESLWMDGDARLEAVDAAMKTPVAMVVEEQDEQGNPRQRPTSIEERTDQRQQAMWSNLNPVQQGIISLGRGGEKAWDMFGIGDIDSAQETVMDAVELGTLNDGIQLLGTVSQFDMVGTGIGAAAKIVYAGLKAGVAAGRKGTMKGIVNLVQDAVKEYGASATNQAMEVVAKTPKGKQAIQAIAKSKDPSVTQKATEVVMDKVQTIAGPLKKSQDIRHADPRLTQQTTLSRTQRQRIGQGRINEEMTKNAAQSQAEAIARATRLEGEIKAAQAAIKAKSQARVAAKAKDAARQKMVDQATRKAKVDTRTAKVPTKQPKSDPRNAQSAAIRASRARKAAKRRQELKDAMKQSPGSR